MEKIQNFQKNPALGYSQVWPRWKWHLQTTEDREEQGGFAAGPLQTPHQLAIQTETG